MVVPPQYGQHQPLFHLPDRLEPAYYLEVNVGTAGSRIPNSYSYVVSAVDGRLLFRKNLERVAGDADELREEIRTTLLHETGHFFGMDEDDLAGVGLE